MEDGRQSAVALTNIIKEFPREGGGSLRAVDDLTLSIAKGEVFSLVGPDGAGKTTAIRMMCGVLPPTSGSVHILGLDVRRQRAEVKQHIGYLSQRFSLYADLTIDENIDFFAEIHHVREYRNRKAELLEMTRLTPFRDRLAGRLSGGMKQKLALACTLVHAPDVIFLDEPTTGVDPVSRRDFWRILSGLLKTGMTIIVSTPYLDEAERSSRVALMSAGKILQCDTPEAVRASFPMAVFEVVVDDVRTAAERLRPRLTADRVQLFGDRLHVLLEAASDPGEPAARLKTLLTELDINARSVRQTLPSLEDVFILRTQR
ncbi:MAG: ABC transporter ATP-binding protein [Bacteroidetes bacterium]|jgi:ABC-2 type transport system ATP-binding protein|nr:ABC transporter ATP-binding protein [Bacteroidota bacterium]